MSTYTELKGLKVKYLAANPDPGTAGDVWYDSATFELKGFVGRAAWSAGAPYVNAAAQDAAAAGTQTAALGAGGYTTGHVATSGEYDGTGWVSGEDMPGNMSSHGGIGTQTAALMFGGAVSPQAQSLEYDGTDWTAGGNLNTARTYIDGAGTQTAGLAIGGEAGSPSALKDEVEEYNGSAWSEQNDLPAATEYMMGIGTQTAALSVGGGDGVPFATNLTAVVAEYDGTNWTTTASINTARVGAGASGTSTNGLIFGGAKIANAGETEQFDGTTWTELADLSTARQRIAGSPSGTGLKALAFTGTTGTKLTSTEEFNNTFDVVTQGAWTSGGNLNTGRKRASGGGTQTAALFAGGFTSPPNTLKSEVEEYNGTAWSEVTDLPAAIQFAGYAGTQTAAISFGGTDPASPNVRVEGVEYDGTNWTAAGNLGTARYRIGGAGTQTAALGFGGYVGSPPLAGVVNAEEYDGSSWTAGGDLGGLRSFLLSCSGIQTDAMCINGSLPLTDTTEIYNGSSWTAGSDTLYGNRSYVASAGTSTSALRLFTGGVASPSPRHSAEVATWDGSAFSTAPSLATSRKTVSSAAAATSATAMAYGGDTHTNNSNLTEEFTVGSTAETGSTIDFD